MTVITCESLPELTGQVNPEQSLSHFPAGKVKKSKQPKHYVMQHKQSTTIYSKDLIKQVK